MNDTPTHPAAHSALNRYGSTMASTDHTQAALTACADLSDAAASVVTARAKRDRAIVKMNRSGMSAPAIARTIREAGYDLTVSGVRYILRGPS